MTQEEKAKRYDEAISIAREYDFSLTGVCAGDVIQYIFPELKESEDERIRKELIAEVKEQIDCIPAPDCRDKEDEKSLKQLNKWLAWFKKQGKTSPVFSNSSNIGKVEQKPDDEIEPKFKVGDIVRNIKTGKESVISDMLKYVYDGTIPFYIKDQDEWELVKQNPAIDMITPEESLGIGSDTYSKIVDECIYGEQKLADKKGMNLVEEEMTPFQKKVFCIIDTTIEEEQGLKQVCDELLALASNEIKQKSAWSEGDERQARQIERILRNDGCSKKLQEQIANWFKSLKYRVQPHWKPNDMELEVLRLAAEKDGTCLMGLYEQLKKLREE